MRQRAEPGLIPSRSTVRVSVSHGSDATLHRQPEREDDDGEESEAQGDQEEGREEGRSGTQEEENNKSVGKEDDQKDGETRGAQAQSRAQESPGSRAGAGTRAVLAEFRKFRNGRC
jgi:hypothetical protein